MKAAVPDAPTGFPNRASERVKLLTHPPAEPVPVPRETGIQNRAAVIVAIAVIAAAAILAIGRYQVSRIESENARPVLTLPRRGGAAPVNDGDVAPGADPDPADVSTLRGRLESVVRLCLAHGAPGRTIRFSVRYMGVTGHAADVHIVEPFAHIPGAECVDRAARTIDLPPFTARDFTAEYSIDLE